MQTRNTALLSALAVVVLAGCPKHVILIDGVEVPYEQAAEQSYERAKARYDDKEYDAAVPQLRTFIETFVESDLIDPAMYYLAKSYQALDREDDAQNLFVTLLQRHPFSKHGPSARLEIGLHSLRENRYNDAIQILRPAYDDLARFERMKAAQALSDASIGLELWMDAVRWLGEARDLVRDPRSEAEIDRQLVALVDGRVPAVGLAQLREELDEDSALFPIVTFKLAKIHYHLRDYPRAMESVQRYLSKWPEGRFASDAKAMASRLTDLSRVNPKVVGVILPMSGKYQAFGEAALRGIGMALDLEAGLAGKSGIQLLVKDSQGDPDVVVRLMEQLVFEDHAIAVLGPLLQHTSMSAAAKAEELGIPILALSRADGLTDMGPWIFRNAVTDKAQAEALVEYASGTLGAKRFGIFYPNHPYGIGMMNHFWKALEDRKLEVRAIEQYDHDQTTFAADIKRMVGRYYLKHRFSYQVAKEKIEREISDPFKKKKALEKLRDALEPIVDFDVLFIPDSYKNVGLIAPALAVEDVITNVCDQRDLARIRKTIGKDRLPTVRLLGGNAWNNPQLVERGGKYVRCSVFVDGFFVRSERDETKAFVEAYVSAYGAKKVPGYLEAHAYDSAGIFGEIVGNRRPATRLAFRSALLEVKDFPGSTGPTSFGPTGEVIKPLFLLTVDRRKGIIEIVPEGGAGG